MAVMRIVSAPAGVAATAGAGALTRRKGSLQRKSVSGNVVGEAPQIVHDAQRSPGWPSA